jgi:hypothetical protein
MEWEMEEEGSMSSFATLWCNFATNLRSRPWVEQAVLPQTRTTQLDWIAHRQERQHGISLRDYPDP